MLAGDVKEDVWGKDFITFAVNTICDLLFGMTEIEGGC